ncbi:MAG: 50S ribosomal protein L33 [Candidatus Omnitrophica bacterium]|nr:50S ribosomal protein L33 [Candidatus Omnitrophota bacterium]
MREIVSLVCTECGARNYVTTKNKKRNKEKIELRKFCPQCKQHKLHKEK